MNFSFSELRPVHAKKVDRKILISSYEKNIEIRNIKTRREWREEIAKIRKKSISLRKVEKMAKHRIHSVRNLSKMNFSRLSITHNDAPQKSPVAMQYWRHTLLSSYDGIKLLMSHCTEKIQSHEIQHRQPITSLKVC